MIDFSSEISELKDYKNDFDTFGRRLFDLHPDVKEKEFSKQEMFALGAQILHTRYQVACIIAQMQNRLEEEGGMSNQATMELMEPVYQAFNKDNDITGPLIDEIAVYKTNDLALSFITRYQDILLSLLEYCETGDPKLLKKTFRDIPLRDLLGEGK